MIICAAADDFIPKRFHGFAKYFRVYEHLLLIDFKFWLHGFFEADGFTCDNIHEWPALISWEYG